MKEKKEKMKKVFVLIFKQIFMAFKLEGGGMGWGVQWGRWSSWTSLFIALHTWSI